MKTDLYTRIVLSVIAFCLLILVLKNTNIISPATADLTDDAKYVAVPLNSDGSINVKLVSDELDVNISRVGGYSLFNGEIKVKIEQ